MLDFLFYFIRWRSGPGLHTHSYCIFRLPLHFFGLSDILFQSNFSDASGIGPRSYSDPCRFRPPWERLCPRPRCMRQSTHRSPSPRPSASGHSSCSQEPFHTQRKYINHLCCHIHYFPCFPFLCFDRTADILKMNRCLGLCF